jgi:hypothetical protein
MDCRHWVSACTEYGVSYKRSVGLTKTLNRFRKACFILRRVTDIQSLAASIQEDNCGDAVDAVLCAQVLALIQVHSFEVYVSHF